MPPSGRTRPSSSLIFAAVRRPALDEVRRVFEAVEEELVVRAEQIDQEPIQRRRAASFSSPHAAAGVEHDPEADRHALGAEVRDLNRLVVLVDEEVTLAADRTRSGLNGRSPWP